MFRKPEKIETIIFLASLLGLFVAVMSFHERRHTVVVQFPTVVYMLFAVFLFCILGQMLLLKIAVRYIFLIVQVMMAIILLDMLSCRIISIEMLLVGLLSVQISLRLSLLSGSIVSAIVLVIFFYIGIIHGCTILERSVLFSLGSLSAFVSESLMYYREQLVDMSLMVRSQQQSLKNLSIANQSFVEHLENVEEDSAERERFRITRELHDSIGYSMTNVAMMMNASRHLIKENPDKLLEYCGKTKEVASETLRETRRILYKLRDIETQKPQNLSIFFDRLCYDFSTATGVLTECNTGNLPEKINDKVFNVLFRTVQVGFINALRHGNASHIKLFFWVDDSELRMTIWNNMQEYFPGEKLIEKEGIGLKGIRERLAIVNGHLTIGSVIDGFRLVLSIPKEELSVESDTGAHSR